MGQSIGKRIPFGVSLVKKMPQGFTSKKHCCVWSGIALRLCRFCRSTRFSSQMLVEVFFPSFERRFPDNSNAVIVVSHAFITFSVPVFGFDVHHYLAKDFSVLFQPPQGLKHIHRRTGQVSIHISVVLVFASVMAFILADRLPRSGFHPCHAEMLS